MIRVPNLSGVVTAARKVLELLKKLPSLQTISMPDWGNREVRERLDHAMGVLEQHGQVLEQQGEALRQMGGLLQELGGALQAQDERLDAMAKRQLWLAGGLGLALVALILLAWRVLAA